LRETCYRAYDVLQPKTPPAWVTPFDSETPLISETEVSALLQFSKEACLWSPSLADTDPSMLLPLLAGLASLCNTELSAGVRNAYAQMRQDPAAATDLESTRESKRGNSTQPPPQALYKTHARHASTTSTTAAAQQEANRKSLVNARTDGITNGLRGLSIALIIFGCTQPTVGLFSLQLHPHSGPNKQDNRASWSTGYAPTRSLLLKISF